MPAFVELPTMSTFLRLIISEASYTTTVVAGGADFAKNYLISFPTTIILIVKTSFSRFWNLSSLACARIA